MNIKKAYSETTRLLGYFKVISDPYIWDNTSRWSWELEVKNLCPEYSESWVAFDNTTASIVASYDHVHPVTNVGGRTLGTLQYGWDRIQLSDDLISLSQTVATLKSTLDAEGIDMLKHLKQLSQKFSDVSTRASAYHIERLLKPYSTKEREIFKAIEELSSKRKGALIVIQREDLLEERLNIGTPMFAEISSSLLDSIFNVNSPLHDGAVLIRNDIIVSAANILPLTKRTFKKRKVGTRHRAAIGLSEITDALIFVVSEETGKESFSFNGSIYPFKIVED